MAKQPLLTNEEVVALRKAMTESDLCSVANLDGWSKDARSALTSALLKSNIPTSSIGQDTLVMHAAWPASILNQEV